MVCEHPRPPNILCRLLTREVLLSQFVPTLFKSGPNSGTLAARDLRARILQNAPEGIDPKKAVIQVLVFFNLKSAIVYDMLAEGVIRAPAELEAFVRPNLSRDSRTTLTDFRSRRRSPHSIKLIHCSQSSRRASPRRST